MTKRQKKEKYIVRKKDYLINWLDGPGLNLLDCKIPHDLVLQLSKLKNGRLAKKFFECCGMPLKVNRIRPSNLSTGLSFVPPETVRKTRKSKFDYFSPQIVIPNRECDEVPFGNVLVNCLLPRSDDLLLSQIFFKEYQAIILKLCWLLKTRPFACITGVKSDESLHLLDYRGFRFFFSCQPKRMLRKIKRVLSFSKEAYEKDSPRAKISAIEKYYQEKFCLVKGKKFGHAFLDDIKLYAKRTILFDLID